MDELQGDGGVVFVKTSSRSAKDTPIGESRLKMLFETFVAEDVDPDLQGHERDNQRLACLVEAATILMQMSRAEKVVDCFARSARIYQDMTLALDRQDRWNENIVVRTWVNMAVDCEFRGFVYHNQLVAISQYNHMLFSPRLLERREHIRSTLHGWFNSQIRDKLTGLALDDSYIIDFALAGETWTRKRTPSHGPERVWVIELNPFATSTDGALFSWQRDEDILHGRQPLSDGPVLRLREHWDPDIITGLNSEWRVLLT
mmetsp:Transcript_41809/g.90702  ORF Transcript_41809/g.90702 Transcript_41809/m.90702 type:complete len:259 (+) Transcript_41809:375-1151(+)